MHFLCKGHYQSLAIQSCNELSSIWFEWMNQASIYYEVGLYQKGLAYAGSAIDISLLLMEKSETQLKGGACKKLALATIYLTNMLKLERQYEKADYYHSGYLEVLKRFLVEQTQKDIIEDVAAVVNNLMDESQHIDFFEDHINLCIMSSNYPQATMQQRAVLH
jgi:hypothetical protein